MGLERVVFPHELPTWGHVRGLLLELQERLLSETVSAEDVAVHIQIIVDAIKTTHCLDQTWLRSKHDLAIGGAKVGARHKVDQYHIWHGMLQFLMETDHEEKEKFLFSTLPNLIELVIRAEDHIPPKELSFSRQQKGGTTVLTRQFVASILACSFLCLFPERTHDRASKLNSINFTHFFKLLPQPSQVAKLRCILCYFEQIIKAGLEISGSITFRRQVAEKTALPSVEDLLKSNAALCPLVVHLEGGIEDADSNAIQVNFANRSIGGGVLGQGKEQEEVRFCTCPELIAALLFMENIEDNEAIIITGFEQFSQCRSCGGLLEYEGPYKVKAEKEPGIVLNRVCIIEAMPYSWGGHKRQYLQSFILKEISKLFVGFCWVETFQPQPLHGVARCTSSDREEDFMTAPENMDDEDASEEVGKLAQLAHTMSYHLLSQGLVEAVHIMSSLDKKLKLPSIPAEDPLDRGDLSPFGPTPPRGGRGQSCSTPQDEPDPLAQVAREELASTPSHRHGGNGECLSLPVLVRLPQNGSCDLLEVDYSEWLANFRRRSSQLSDLTSRRSSSSTKHSSELSSDLEEIYENLVQAEKLQHGIIEEEYYGSAVSDYAAQFVDSLMHEGTSIAAQMLPGMRHFDQMTPLEGVHRPMAVRFAGSGVLCNFTAAAEDENGENDDLDFMVNDEAVGSNRMQFHTFSIPEFAQSIVESAVKCGAAEASLCLLSREVDHKPDRNPDDIPDDVYRWFADKIVQEVFAHVVDELYFQRFTSESFWRTDLCVNREGIPRRADQIERTESMSSSSSISSCSGSADLPNKSLRASAFQTFAPESVQKPEEESLEGRSSLGSGCKERVSVSKTVRLGDMPEPWPGEVGKKMPASIKFSGRVVEDEAAKSSLTASVCSIPPTSPKVSVASPQVQKLWLTQFSAEEQNSTIAQSWFPEHDGGSLCSEETGALKSPLISAQGVLPNREMSVETPVALKSTVASASLQTLTDDSGAVGTTFSCESQTSAADQSSSLSAQDLNLDYYKMAATIVNQVFQSLPDYINKMAEGEKGSGPRSLLYSFHGRKYDSSIAPRSSYEAAAMAIGSLDKGNVVRESYLSAVSGASGASGDVGSRRIRSQSPSKTWLSKRLSRETLTNAFLRTENKPAIKSYERRSSEPCQRSVNLSLQAYGSHCDRSEDRRYKKSRTDDDLESVKADSWRRSSLDSIPLDRRRSSCGFKDPVLSRFAQELMNADISVPQLFLVGSGSSPSTTGSRRSSVSGFRDTTLATFESELLNSSFGQTLPSPWLRYPNFSQSRESRLWKSDSSETEYWFPIPRRVGTEFQEELERINRCQSVDEVEDYADFVATTILQQAVSILHHDMKEVTQEDEDISIFSENLADQILREGLVAAVETSSTGRSIKFSHSVSGSEQDFSLSSHDLTAHSYDDHQLDFCDALDIPYSCVDSFAANLAQSIMLSVVEQFGEVLKRFVPYGRPIATGNWDWKGFHGDPFLKMLIQWIAASIAQAPQLIYFTLGDERLNQMHALARLLNEQNWTVGQLMTSIQAYCLLVLDEMDLWEKDTDALATSDVDRFIPSQTLFDFLLCQL